MSVVVQFLSRRSRGRNITSGVVHQEDHLCLDILPGEELLQQSLGSLV